MSKRYYLADIIGDGTEINPYRPAVADHGVAWVGVIDSDPETGAPLYANTIALVETENHAKLRADTRIDPLPDFALDGKLTAIKTAARNGMLKALSKRGFATAAINNADGYRDALQQIGRQRGAAFDINNFDVS